MATLFLLSLLVACSPIRLLNTLVPEDGLKATRDIAFGAEPRLKLDVYRPAGASATPRPVVVFFYGGAWEGGEKGDFFFAAEALTSRGYVVVVPDLRVYPQVVYPAFMDDAARAVRWATDHAAEYGGDPAKMFTMGHSSGGHVAAMVAFEPRFLAAVGGDARRIRGVVSLAGPMDFLPLTEPNLFKIFPEPVRDDSQPINHIDGRQPPVLLLHGLDDKRVGLHNPRNLAARINTRGGRVETDYYPGMGHPGIVAAIAAPLRSDKPVLDRVAKFIDQEAARPAP